jgi:hypothetical protein
MTGRTVLAVLSCLLTLNLPRVSVESACARHGDASPAEHHGGQHSGSPAHQHSDNSSEAPTPEGIPTSAGCCSALLSCGSAVGLGANEASLVPALDHRAARYGHALLYSFRIATPEPPPPRA